MKKLINILAISFISINTICCTQNFNEDTFTETYKPLNGDIIFHTSKSLQSPIIQKITDSKLSHCGIIYIKNNIPYVFEASNKVKLTRLEAFINNGVDKKFEVFRYKKELSINDQKNMFLYAQDQLGKSYDLKFEFSDNEMYCSELVWKIYKSVGIELSSPTKFIDYDLSSKEALNLIESRYNTKINLNEDVVTPIQITQDHENLFPVYQNYRSRLYAF